MTPIFCPHCGQARRPEMARILDAVGEVMEVSREDLMAHSRVRRLVIPRQMAMLVMFRAGYSQSAIGRFMGRDHSTIIHGVEKAEVWMQTRRVVSEACRRIMDRLQAEAV